MIEVYTGKCGSGKTLKLADKICGILARNDKWFKKTGHHRQIATNAQLSPEFCEQYKNKIIKWNEPMELVKFKDVDIFWDEISTHLDSQQWANLPLEVKRFLQQHRKRGIDIYGTTQTFAAVDVALRRLVDNLFVCRKIMGSRNPSPTKPPIKHIWGIIWLTELEPLSFEDEKPKNIGWDWLQITRDLINVYDTTYEIEQGHYPPLKHIERTCIDPNCTFKRVAHV